MRHPYHDELVAAVRGWYTSSFPDMGYMRERREFGYYMRNPHMPSGSVTLRIDAVEQVERMIEDVRDYYAGAPVTLYVDDPQLDAMLGPALAAIEGCSAGTTTTYLAHARPLPPYREVAGLAIEAVGEERLDEYVIAKIKGFANTEMEPDARGVEEEVAQRRAETAGDGRFALAMLGRKTAGAVGYYIGEDWLVFDLATRVRYRRHGIATTLLRWVLEQAHDRGARSVVINADEYGAPARLYRGLGFEDEVYWQHAYRLAATNA